MPFFRKKDPSAKKEPEKISELEKQCYEEKIYIHGKEVFVSPELRDKLYHNVIGVLPLYKVLDDGFTPTDRKKLDPRRAAAVSMRDERILTDPELQKEVRGYLEQTVFQSDNFLEENENALYIIFYLAHQCVKNYQPKIEEKKDLFAELQKLMPERKDQTQPLS